MSDTTTVERPSRAASRLVSSVGRRAAARVINVRRQPDLDGLAATGVTRAEARAGGDRVVIDDPQMLEIADRIVDTLRLATEKALAHQAEPSKFPLAADGGAAEQIVLRLAKARPKAALKKAAAKALQRIERPAAERQRDFGLMAALDLKSAMSVEGQVARLAPATTTGAIVAELARFARPTTMFDLASLGAVTFATGSLTTAATTAIDAKHAQLGGAGGFLGAPKAKEAATPDRVGRFRHYAGGSIYWTPQTNAHEVHGDIREKWKSLGWERSFLGYPTTDELTTPDGKGRFNHIQGGSIYWTPQTGAHEVHGAIRVKWSQLGWETGYLGYPLTDEITTPDGIGRFNHFQGGSIYWTPMTGAHAVHKDVRAAWEQQRWELGSLGYPTSDTAGVGSASMGNHFQGGRVDWTKAGGAKVERTMTKLQFRLHSVKCVDETGRTNVGSDEIDMGGVATNAAMLSTQFSKFRVHSDFDSGETKSYSPPKVVHTFDLLEHAWWPKSYLVTMMLAEIDSGGFNDTLKELLLKVRDLVEKELVKIATAALGAAAGAALGAAFGSVLPVVGTALGVVIGALVGYVIGAVFDFLLELFEDDAFLPLAVPIDIASVHQRWSGRADSADWFYWVKGHRGHYEIRGDWALVP